MCVEDKVRGLPIVHSNDMVKLGELCLEPHGEGRVGMEKREGVCVRVQKAMAFEGRVIEKPSPVKYTVCYSEKSEIEALK